MTRIILIGCGKQKQEQAAPARDLYTGNLFRARMHFANQVAEPGRVFILSAKHGLINPNAIIEPYDRTLDDVGAYARATWSIDVVRALIMFLNWPTDPNTVVEIHAGRRYADQVAGILSALGVQVVRPLQSLGIGEQLAWYKAKGMTEKVLAAARSVLNGTPGDRVVSCRINGKSIDVQDLRPKDGETDRDWICRVAEACDVENIFVHSRQPWAKSRGEVEAERAAEQCRN